MCRSIARLPVILCAWQDDTPEEVASACKLPVEVILHDNDQIDELDRHSRLKRGTALAVRQFVRAKDGQTPSQIAKAYGLNVKELLAEQAALATIQGHAPAEAGSRYRRDTLVLLPRRFARLECDPHPIPPQPREKIEVWVADPPPRPTVHQDHPQEGSVASSRAASHASAAPCGSWVAARVRNLMAGSLEANFEHGSGPAFDLQLASEHKRWRRRSYHDLWIPKVGDALFVESDDYPGEADPIWRPAEVRSLSADGMSFTAVVDNDEGYEETFALGMEGVIGGGKGGDWVRASHEFARRREYTLAFKDHDNIRPAPPPELPEGFLASLAIGKCVEVRRLGMWCPAVVKIVQPDGRVVVKVHEGDDLDHLGDLEALVDGARGCLRPCWRWDAVRGEHVIDERVEAISELAESEAAREEAQEEPASEDEGEREHLVSDDEARDDEAMQDLGGAGASADHGNDDDVDDDDVEDEVEVDDDVDDEVDNDDEEASKDDGDADANAGEEVEEEMPPVAPRSLGLSAKARGKRKIGEGDEEGQAVEAAGEGGSASVHSCYPDLDGFNSDGARSAEDDPDTLSSINVEKVRVAITKIEEVRPEQRKDAMKLLAQAFFLSPGVDNALLGAMLFKKSGFGSTVQNYLSPSQVINMSGEELRYLHVALATIEDGRGGTVLLGVACLSRVPKSRRDLTFKAATIMLFGVDAAYRGRGVGSKMFNAIQAWAAEQQPGYAQRPPSRAPSRAAAEPQDSLPRANAGECESKLLILSAEPAQEAENWWLHQLRRQQLHHDYEMVTDPNELKAVLNLSGAEPLPTALWSPWCLGKTRQDVLILAISVRAITNHLERERRAVVRSAPFRKLIFKELCAGSGRLTREALRCGNQAVAYERNPAAIEYDDPNTLPEEALLPRGSSAVKVMDINDLKTLGPCDFAMLELSCKTVSRLASSTQRRLPENHFRGDRGDGRPTDDAIEYDKTLQHALDLFTMAKNNDPEFAFVLEQPDCVVKHLPIVHTRLLSDSSRIRCDVIKFSWCKAANVRVHKPTLFFVHNLPELVDYFGPEDEPKFLCTADSPCAFGGPGCHDSVRGDTKEWTPYPHDLCKMIVNIVSSALARKRKQPLARACEECTD